MSLCLGMSVKVSFRAIIMVEVRHSDRVRVGIRVSVRMLNRLIQTSPPIFVNFGFLVWCHLLLQ